MIIVWLSLSLFVFWFLSLYTHLLVHEMLDMSEVRYLFYLSLLLPCVIMSPPRLCICLRSTLFFTVFIDVFFFLLVFHFCVFCFALFDRFYSAARMCYSYQAVALRGCGDVSLLGSDEAHVVTTMTALRALQLRPWRRLEGRWHTRVDGR